MIDDKKIEEGARDYINKNGYFVKYDEDPCVDIEFAYKEGAKWAINEFLKGLWHDASEEPKERNENIIVLQDEDEDDESNPLYASLIHARHDTFPWNEFCEDNAIYKWCYFKEIAPKKGDLK